MADTWTRRPPPRRDTGFLVACLKGAIVGALVGLTVGGLILLVGHVIEQDTVRVCLECRR